ncbi:hypothetical protein [Micromonospora chersina]|uniref:hypothetical protein n=1 Tax=Micromonospora chersina TaxID=47854 RepID=UPI003715D5D4
MDTKKNGPVGTRTASDNNDLVNRVSGHGWSGTPAWQRTGGGAAAGGAARRRSQHKPLSGVASVLAGQPWFLKASPERRRQMLQVVQDAAQRAAARKARVAAYPDLAQRVCSVLGLKRYAQWGGYVPARQPGGGAADTGFDPSLIRRELVAILQEAVERDQAGLQHREAGR